jgi:hypothetical protein
MACMLATDRAPGTASTSSATPTILRSRCAVSHSLLVLVGADAERAFGPSNYSASCLLVHCSEL